MPKIFCVSPELHGQIFELSGPRLTIGRAADNAIPIPDASVSSRHAELILEDRDYAIRDLDSTNGTRINGEKTQQASLRRGDAIRLGNIELRYDSEHEPVLLPYPPQTGGLQLDTSVSQGRPVHFAASPAVKHGGEEASRWPLLIAGAAVLAAVAIAFFLWTALKS